MVDFAKLAAEAKARRLAAEEAAANGTELPESHAHDTEAHAESSTSAPESPTVPSTPPAGEGEAKRPANPFGRRKDSGSGDQSQPVGEGLDSSSGGDSGDKPAQPRLSAVSLGARSQPTGSDASGLAAPTLDSLDALDQSDAEGIAPRQSVSAHFADETPAQKPTRELPADLTKEQLGFIDMIDGVYEVVHEPDLMGGVIRNIIIELKSNPEYMKLVAPDDIRAWVRGMRESMGLAKIKKTETKAKKAGGAGKKSKLIDDDMLADLNDLGVDIPV
jgi:hypothetical protein